MIKVGIIEDQKMILNLLADLCIHEFGWQVTMLSPNAKAAMLALEEGQPDAVLVDINLPDEDGIILAMQIKQKYPRLKCVMLTAECSEYTVFRVRQSGLHGYIDKNSDPEVIKTALERVVIQGMPYFTPLVKEVSITTARDDGAFSKVLGDREQELVALFGMAIPDIEIAILKGIAPETVKKHRENIMRKLGIHTTPELIHYCIEKGFLQIRPDGQIRPTVWPPFKAS